MNDTPDAFAIAPDWRERAWSLLRVVVFIAAFFAVNIAVNYGLHQVLPPKTPPEQGAFLASIGLALSILALTFVMAKVTGRPFGIYGFAGPHRLRNFIYGTIAGIALLAGLLVLQSALGVFSFGAISGTPESLAIYAGILAVMFFAVALSEEFLFRGYVLVELSRAISFWPAALVMAALFGFAHFANEGPQGVVGGAEAFLFAMVAAIAFLKTGSLWLSIGLHFGWDYAESYIFGLGDSGHVATNSLLHGAAHGADMLTGGTVGPEGTPLATIFLLVMLAVVWALRSRRNAAVV